MKNLDFGKIIRWGLILFMFGSIAAVFIWNMTATPEKDYSSSAWNLNMAMGDPKAENHFIEYADSMCPYCANFTLALDNDMDKFKEDYINNGKVYFEVRIADIVSAHNVNSHRGNTATYCAAEQKKFWEFYPALQNYLNDTFYKKGIGNEKSAKEMPKIEDKTYIEIAKKVGVDTKEFTSCLDSEKIEKDLERASKKAVNLITGAPYFAFGKYKSSGFPQSGDYATIQQMFRAGGLK